MLHRRLIWLCAAVPLPQVDVAQGARAGVVHQSVAGLGGLHRL